VSFFLLDTGGQLPLPADLLLEFGDLFLSLQALLTLLIQYGF